MSQQDNNAWLPPKEVAEMLACNLRTVYRLVDRGVLVASGEKRNRVISLASVQKLLATRLIDSQTVIDSDSLIDSQQERQKPKADNNAASVALMALQQDRQNLLSRLEELHELRRQDALLIGSLQERVKQLESSLESPQTAPQPRTGTEPLQPIEIPLPAADKPLKRFLKKFW